MKRLTLAALTIAFVSFLSRVRTAAFRQFSYRRAQGQTFEWINFCNGYVQAMISGHYDGSGQKKLLCIPAGTTRAGIVGAVAYQAFTAQPALQHSNAATAVYALTNIFRCP